MILVDTSIWIDHLRGSDQHLSVLLAEGRVVMHPHVLGEVALGSLKNRAAVLGAMSDLPQTVVATDDEVLRFIEAQGLFGLGIGYMDAHLLAAVMLTPGTRLWTRDRRLSAASARLGLTYALAH
ncbi:type II toxin-antitoxin system VapC family toxin [Thauera aromatica]|uniref:type II toxin-antitoxin system VapC family toxin n=1 Tax=Thauera aromatica TaxID=59405 RepID=UPI001FFDD3E7|nr:type II toxin-antitoxin system VapC family toxin [Thauera aromatica]MCK2089374.1 type II toxin-antitoxin system VapC family toxin [Thauera aromatica]MCK2126527.1 type II toxin-antitoxin system VapC family toxin [Thauera aromatica]